MRKITVLTGATLLLLLSGGTASANDRPVCEIAQRLEAQAPGGAAAAGTIRGIVRSVVGDVVTLTQPNGKTTRVSLTKRERGSMGHLIGRDVVISNIYCQRISLAPPPAPPRPAVRPIQLPQGSTPSQPQAAPARPVPPAPRPVVPAAPIPAPAPVIIPQTW